mmetsp:Transcript_4169/g.18733  ORF Transcript_4169/g.18733 Transcript_4169/m.18733 type:complete len:222 (+) Transcript_4169:2095-2760(+)
MDAGVGPGEGGGESNRRRVHPRAQRGRETQGLHRHRAAHQPGDHVPGRAHHRAGQHQRGKGGGHPQRIVARGRHRAAQHPSAPARHIQVTRPRAGVVRTGRGGIRRPERPSGGALCGDALRRGSRQDATHSRLHARHRPARVRRGRSANDRRLQALGYPSRRRGTRRESDSRGGGANNRGEPRGGDGLEGRRRTARRGGRAEVSGGTIPRAVLEADAAAVR